jgi:elongation factor P--(R)-beta-lysine ligase
MEASKRPSSQPRVDLDFATRASIANLKLRADLLRRLRSFFDERGFTEVQTPVICRETIIDRHLDPIEARVLFPGEPVAAWFLQTSPEQSMKRLLCSEIGSIYQIGPVFRQAEFGRLHNIEFTMAEWYDVDADLEHGLQFLEGLLSQLLGTTASDRVRFEQAFLDATGIALFRAGCQELSAWAVAHDLVQDHQWTQDWDDWVNLIFSERVQPGLGLLRPVIVTHFPASQAALAQLCLEDPRTAERYEAFYQGVELANGYHELLDASILQERAREANALRITDGKESLPLQNRLLNAMRSGMPSSCGCALGFDRVVMLACGANSLEQVVAFSSRDA